MMHKLYIIRGVPGCGKTTFAESICDSVISADDFWMVDGEYRFDISKLSYAHRDCQTRARAHMTTGEDLAIANTNTTLKEMKPYFDMADEMGYMVFSIIVENRHNGKNVHNVPAETLEKMKNRFDVEL